MDKLGIIELYNSSGLSIAPNSPAVFTLVTGVLMQCPGSLSNTENVQIIDCTKVDINLHDITKIEFKNP